MKIIAALTFDYDEKTVIFVLSALLARQALRSSQQYHLVQTPEVFYKKGVLRNFTKFYRTPLHDSFFVSLGHFITLPVGSAKGPAKGKIKTT